MKTKSGATKFKGQTLVLVGYESILTMDAFGMRSRGQR